MTPEQSPEPTPSVLWKAFDILRAFSAGNRTLSLAKIAQRSNLPKSTAHRVLAMLVELGAVVRVGDVYRISIDMFALGALSMDGRNFDAAFPHLAALHAFTKSTVHLATAQGDQVIFLDKLVGSNSPPTPARIGGRLPMQRTAVGKAILAFRDLDGDILSPDAYSTPTTTFREPQPLGEYLATVRRHGVAIEREESAPGVVCIAALLDIEGQLGAAIEVATYATNPNLLKLVEPVRQTAAAISRAITAVGRHSV